MSPFASAIAALQESIVASLGGGAEQSGIGFEIGTPVPVEELTPARALEFMSQLANVVPSLSAGLFGRTARSVDGMYEMLLLGSRPSPGTDLPFYEAIKSNALSGFQEVLGSFEGPTKFHPVHATPDSWFDLRQAGNWTHQRIEAGDEPPPHVIPGLLDFRLEQWMVVPDPPQDLLTQPVTIDAVRRLQMSLRETEPLVGPAPTDGAVIRLQPEARVQLFENALRMQASGALTRRGGLAFGVEFSDHIPLVVSGVGSVDETQPQGPDEGSAVMPVLDLAPWHFATDVVSHAESKPVTTRKLTIEFDMCIVRLRRNWLSDGFLALPQWYVPGFRSGDFSQGTPLSENAGLLSAVPIACVLTKDVTIQADWTPEDLDVLGSSVSAGPFSLLGRSFDAASGSIRVPGVQALAWMCHAPGVLPPQGDPSLD